MKTFVKGSNKDNSIVNLNFIKIIMKHEYESMVSNEKYYILFFGGNDEEITRWTYKDKTERDKDYDNII